MDRSLVPFTVLLLLLYEGVVTVGTVPVVVSGGAAPQSSSTLQNHYNGGRYLAMPVWARKAGGNWKPELVQAQEAAFNKESMSSPESSLGEHENIMSDQVKEDVQSDVIKRQEDEAAAGNNVMMIEDNRSLQKVDQQLLTADPDKSEKDESKEEEEEENEDNDEYEYEYEELRPEEQECPDSQFWHVRGLKCVPLVCPGGNSYRDKHTGDCILKHYRRNRWRSRPWRPYNVYRRPFFGGAGGARGLRVLLFG